MEVGPELERASGPADQYRMSFLRLLWEAVLTSLLLLSVAAVMCLAAVDVT